MRWEDLRYFVAVAQDGHVGRAAQRLGISQPALTKGVQRLEQALGLQLFERGPKGMSLTSVGTVFFTRAQQLCLGLDEALQEASDLHLGAIGVIRVGASPIFAEQLVAESFALLLRQRPGAQVRLTIGLNDTLRSSLRLGDLDMCISALDDREPHDLVQTHLFDDELCVVLRDEHPLLRRASLRLADLADAGWALPGPQVLARRRLEARLVENGLPLPRVVACVDNSMALVPALLRGSDLLAVMSRSTLGSAAGRGLAALPLAQVTSLRRIGVINRRDAYLSPLALRFMELLQEQAGKFRLP